MSKKFNLWLLNQPQDKHPRSWLCFGGKKLRKILMELKTEILKNQRWSKNRLDKEIANQLGCSISTIGMTLRTNRKFYPVTIMKALLKFNDNRLKFLKEITKNIEYLKINSASASPLRPIDKLNKNLAKILGAFMADGSLSVQIVIAASDLQSLKEVQSTLTNLKIRYSTGSSPSRNQHYVSIQANKENYHLLNKILQTFHMLTQTHYNIELCDEYKDNVMVFTKWIKDEFGIEPNRFVKYRNAWRVTFSNKVLARYLMLFFEVKPSYKSYYVFEPRVIKSSNLNIRKAFAKGVLMFDGCITGKGKIAFSTVSLNLFTSIKQIWDKDNIKFGQSINERRSSYNPKNSYILFNLSTTSDNKKRKLLKYFEPRTQKWKLLNWLSGDLTYVPILKVNRSLSLDKVSKVLKKVKACDANFLKNHFKCAHGTIRAYLKVLNNQKKIKLSNKPKQLSEYIDESGTVLLKNKAHQALFNKIKESFGKYKNCASFLGTHKTAFSAWKVRKNRMPIFVLKKLCEVFDFNFIKFSENNIEKIDREVAEVT
jgi:hypothetical protein